MTRQITPAAVLNPTAGTLDLSAVSGFDVRRLKVVLDAKTGAMVYGPVPGFGYSALANGVMTLQAAVAALSASDPLIVMYDDSTGKAAEDGTDITGAVMPAGGAGLRGWLSAMATRLGGTLPVSISALPLPANAAQDGTDVTGVAMPTGGAGLRGWLSAIYQRLSGTVAISALTLPLPAGAAQDQTLGQAVTALGQILSALGLLGTDADVQATTGKVEQVRALLAGTIKVDPSAVTAPISAVALPLPAGAATEGTLATIKQILAAQASIAESTWYDPTVTPQLFYFRRVVNTDGVITQVWTDPAGNAVAFNANWKPISSSETFQVMPAVSYDVKTAFTGASVDDVIVRVIILNIGVSPPVIAATMWLNANTGQPLSSVTMANLKEVTRDVAIPDGYFATFGSLADAPAAGPGVAASYMGSFRGFWTNWLARVPVLGTALMAGSAPVTLATDDKAALVLGGVGDTAITSDGAQGSIPAILRRGLGNWTALLGRIPAQGAATAAASLPVALATDQLSKLAQDGADAAGSTNPGTGIRGWLSGLYGKIPALGIATKAGSLPVALASDQVTLLAQDGTDTTMPSGVTAPTTGGGIRGWLSSLWVQATALLTTLGSQGDVAATSDAGSFSIIAVLKRMLGNDTQAFALVQTATTREGSLTAQGSYPEAMDSGASGRLGALQRIWANLVLLLAATKATQPRSIASNAPRVVQTGSLSAIGDAVMVACDGMNTVVLQQTGNAATTGASVFEASADGATTWFAVNMQPYAGGALAAGLSFSAATQVYEMACGGLTHVRLRCTAAFSVATAALAIAAAGHKSLRVGAPAANPVPVSSTKALPVVTAGVPTGIGNDIVMPTLANAYGTAFGNAPAGARSLAFWVPPGAAIAWTVQPITTAYTSGSPMPANVTKSFTNPYQVGQWLEEFFDPTVMALFLKSASPGTDAAQSPIVPRWN